MSGISGELDLLGVNLVIRGIHASIATHPAGAVAKPLDVLQAGPAGNQVCGGLVSTPSLDQLPQRARAAVLVEGAVNNNLPAAAAPSIGSNFQLQFGHGFSRLAVA